MSSHTDKKEEFRKYLEKSSVLATLTEILTDLFEMETKPEDPARYVYQKLGESLDKVSGKPTKPSNGPISTEPADKDANMVDVAPSTQQATNNPVPTQATEASATPNAAVSAPVPVSAVNATQQSAYPANTNVSQADIKPEANAKPDATMTSAPPVQPSATNPSPEGATVPDGNAPNSQTTTAPNANATPAATGVQIPSTNPAPVQ